MEGRKFSSNLFELTYICIDDIVPVALQYFLTPKPANVSISLELFDGAMIACSKKFYYVDPNIADNLCHIFTTRNQYDGVLSSPV